MAKGANRRSKLLINLKAAKALGLTIPAGALSIADGSSNEWRDVRLWPLADIPICRI
jgi:hypothetical protein